MNQLQHWICFKFQKQSLRDEKFRKICKRTLRNSLFFNKFAGLSLQVFSCEFDEIFKNTIFTEYLPYTFLLKYLLSENRFILGWTWFWITSYLCLEEKLKANWNNHDLNPFSNNAPFLYPLKMSNKQKCSVGIEMEHCPKMS